MSAPLNVVVLGLSLSSSWGNGHATTYRALLKAFAARGHAVTFLERDVPWYAGHRDLVHPDFCRLELYHDLKELHGYYPLIAAADAVVVGSYVPDGIAIGEWVQASACGVTVFYDIDTPVTLAKLERDECDYLSPDLIAGYDLYLSFTGGPTLDRLMHRYRARAARALYCSVDTDVYRPVSRDRRWDLSYLGTYSADRQPALERLLVEPARQAPHLRFAVAGPQYPNSVTWPDNVERIHHVAPDDHAAFYGSSRFTLNVTRKDMVRAGYSPSVRLFEAAACATPIISDVWPGLDTFFTPDRGILLARNSQDVLDALTKLAPRAAGGLGVAARKRVTERHSAAYRAGELESYVHEAVTGSMARYERLALTT